MRATEEDETRCCGDAVPLLWLLAAPPGPPLPPAAAGALATGFQCEQPGCGSGPFSSAVLLLLPLVPAPTFAVPALAAAEDDWGGAEEDWGGAEEDWGGAEVDWGGAEEAWGEAGTAADVVPASPDAAESLLSVAWILKIRFTTGLDILYKKDPCDKKKIDKKQIFSNFRNRYKYNSIGKKDSLFHF